MKLCFMSFPDVPMIREAGASRLGSQAGAWEPADGRFFTVINNNDVENERKVNNDGQWQFINHSLIPRLPARLFFRKDVFAFLQEHGVINTH